MLDSIRPLFHISVSNTVILFLSVLLLAQLIIPLIFLTHTCPRFNTYSFPRSIIFGSILTPAVASWSPRVSYISLNEYRHIGNRRE